MDSCTTGQLGLTRLRVSEVFVTCLPRFSQGIKYAFHWIQCNLDEYLRKILPVTQPCPSLLYKLEHYEPAASVLLLWLLVFITALGDILKDSVGSYDLDLEKKIKKKIVVPVIC